MAMGHTLSNRCVGITTVHELPNSVPSPGRSASRASVSAVGLRTHKDCGGVAMEQSKDGRDDRSDIHVDILCIDGSQLGRALSRPGVAESGYARQVRIFAVTVLVSLTIGSFVGNVVQYSARMSVVRQLEQTSRTARARETITHVQQQFDRQLLRMAGDPIMFQSAVDAAKQRVLSQ